jgi:hypothetical protein
MSRQQATWQVQSSRETRVAASMGLLVVGALLAYGFRAMEGPVLSGSRAGFALGVLLMGLGAGSFLFGYEETITIDTRQRRVFIERSSWRGSSRRDIPFDEIAEAHVEQLGDPEGGTPSYHVAVKLRSGGSANLFVGLFPGMWDRSAMESRCVRLLESVRVS